MGIGVNQSKNYNRAFAPSPVFTYSVPALTQNQIDIVFWESQDPSSVKYLPFDTVRIINNSSEIMEFYNNDDDKLLRRIPAGVITTLDRAQIGGSLGARFKNVSATATAAGEVVAEFSRAGQDPTNFLMRLHERFFGGGS